MRGVIKLWVWTYTSLLPGRIRARRRAELRSDLWEQEEDDRKQGFSRHAAALRLLVRALVGLPADIAWALPIAMARGRKSLERAVAVAYMLLLVLTIALLGRFALLGRSGAAGKAGEDPAIPFALLIGMLLLYLVHFDGRVRASQAAAGPD
ncbi:MAG: hypothetical protein ACREOQ_22345 [Gemmatimonadales bacterium]